jgi:hypothetical protein
MEAAMTDRQHDPELDANRRNDTRLLTPLILMALIVVCGLLFYTYRGDSSGTAAQQAAQPAQSSTH